MEHKPYNPFAKLGPAKIRASELEKCMYCGNKLPSKSGEHLFCACLGGSHKSTKLICDDCNQAFAAIDDALFEHAKFIMNAWGFKGDRHKEVPIIPLPNGYELGPFASPRLATPKLTATAQPDGSHAIRVVTNSKGEARRFLLDKPSIELATGKALTPEQKQDLLRQISGANKTKEEPQPVALHPELRIKDEYRSAAHTVLKCAALYDPNLVMSPHTESIRQFARYGEGAVSTFAVNTQANLTPFVQIMEAFGVLQNTALVYWSKTEGKVLGVYHLLGRVTRSVIIADNYTGPEAFLCVYESVRGSSEMKAIYAELESDLPPTPLITITLPAPSEATISIALQKLVDDCMVDSIHARLLDAFDRQLTGTPLSTEQIDQVRTLLATALTELARASNKQLSLESALGRLDAAKAAKSTLSNLLGSVSNSGEVQTAIAKWFKDAAHTKLLVPPQPQTDTRIEKENLHS